MKESEHICINVWDQTTISVDCIVHMPSAAVEIMCRPPRPVGQDYKGGRNGVLAAVPLIPSSDGREGHDHTPS